MEMQTGQVPGSPVHRLGLSLLVVSPLMTVAGILMDTMEWWNNANDAVEQPSFTVVEQLINHHSTSFTSL